MSWVCPKGHTVGDIVVERRLVRDPLICPACAAKDSERALQAIQAEYLRCVAKGDFPLRVTRRQPRHALLFQSYTHAYCGTVFAEAVAKGQIEYPNYTPEGVKNVCPGCRNAIAYALQEAGGSQGLDARTTCVESGSRGAIHHALPNVDGRPDRPL